MSLTEKYDAFAARMRTHFDLAAALRLLEWDQETYMPAGVIELRARQIGTLSEVLHRQQTEAAFVDLVDELHDRLTELTAEQAVDVRETKWRIDRERALEPALVQRRSTLHAETRNLWIEARQRDDFKMLAPYLQQIVDIERTVAAAIDSSRAPYDVLLEAYEPGARSEDLTTLFAILRQRLRPLVERLRQRDKLTRAQPGALRGRFAIDAQRALNRELAERLGLDFKRARLDEAAHPFSTDIGDDTRITTRYSEHDLSYALYSTIHETGHALYEQGLQRSALGLPRGTSCSLGVHESQSRLWENLVGRSEAFWCFLLPVAQRFFPSLRDVSVAAAVQAVNDARPSLIRTEADEITYNMHIILRFELERELIAERLKVADLPAAWRSGMQENLGVVPSTDREGVLQDVHWPSGAIGYFPTYSLGNIYAAQLMEAAEQAVGPLGPQIEIGEFQPLLQWLRDHVHRQGQCYRAPQLIERATATGVSAEPLLRHLERRVDWLEQRQ